ncbi:MAG TPA: hypothetical protein VIP82_16240 [Microbacterium sp.]|uniref:hypothetical protein n=1 Tax=Microbacterium sp. TaxID=51671 RepID=UPI002F92F18E
MSGYADDARNPEQNIGAGDAMTGETTDATTGVTRDATTGATTDATTGVTRDATSGVTPGETPTGMSGATTETHEYTATTDHEVIRRWAEDRHATPATVGGAEGDGIVGELRLDFDFGNDLEDLRAVTWEEWFVAFDERGDQFVYQDTTRADGSRSNDFHLEERRAL